MANNPFTTPILRDWFLDQFGAAPIDIEVVSTTGSGPFEESEFDDFLERFGIEFSIVDEDTEILVVGEEDWDPETLEEMLRERSGETLQAYSQEMFLSFLASGVDPLDEGEKLLRSFGEGHPALEFLSAAGFDWPTTTIVGGGGSELQAEWLEKGYLSYLGYTVGRRGLTTPKRRAVLKQAYSSEVPKIFPQWYREVWGRPGSSVRLQKIAGSIATFCRNGRRRPHAMEVAISHWETDLDWLKRTYYDGKRRFEWPSTSVW